LIKKIQKSEFFGPNYTGKTHVIFIRRKKLKHSKGKSIQVKLIFFHFFVILTNYAPSRLLVNLEYAKLAVIHALEQLDMEFGEKYIDKDCGCTAVVCIVSVLEKICITANAGDSRAIIGMEKQAKHLTRDQDPMNPIEFERVKGSWGGRIDADGYVNDQVNMTRCIGDRKGKFHEENGWFSRSYAIVSAPEVRVDKITQACQFLILCCDGLFEDGCFKSATLVSTARDLLKEVANLDEENQVSNPAKKVAQKLCQKAIKDGSADNVSVLMVLFSHDHKDAIKNEGVDDDADVGK